MYKQHGTRPGRTCGECSNLITYQYGGRYFKCGLSRVTSSAASDWRKKWTACGKFLAADEVDERQAAQP
jgi:hypothetical protein